MIKEILLGGGAGVLVTFIVWKIASKSIDKQLAEGAEGLLSTGEAEMREEIRATINREVPPVVRREVEQKLRSFGLTPTTGAQISRILNYADRVGII